MGFGTKFLRQPSLFPARLAGTPAGSRTLGVDVAGGPYVIRGLSEEQLDALEERYGERCLPSEELAGTDLHLFGAEESEFNPVERSGRLNRFDFDYQQHTVRMAGDQLMASMSWRPHLVAALWTPLEAGTHFLETFENCFRVVVAYRLLELGGAVLHSSGVVDQGRAWIFFGHSGAGKTTVARRSLAAGRTVLSDDINALWMADGQAVAARMPFAGELGHSNERAGPFPLGGLSRLEQASSTSWKATSPGRAVAALLACSPFTNHDPHRLPVLLANLEALARTARTGILGCSLEEDFWPVLEEEAS